MRQIILALFSLAQWGLAAEVSDPFAKVPHDDATFCELEQIPFQKLFDLPTALIHLPDGSSVVACQRGMFWRIDLKNPAKPVGVFLDFRETMKHSSAFEDGVHGIALHPEFTGNGRLFLSYTQNNPRRTVLSEMQVDLKNDFKVMPATEKIFFELEQPLADHWGGQILFGPEDGKLYLGLGDGGLRNDPYRMPQNLWSLHGKILRIDIDKTSGDRLYGIPADNPFIHNQLVRPEIYASGLRNPWGLAFDEETGYLWCADVGQDYWEEINRIEKGGNYGWSDRDGPHRLAAHPEPLLKDSTPIDPVFAYTRTRLEGICIIGGMVYRGARFPELIGSYIYGEWGFGFVEAIHLNEEATEATRRLTLHRKKKDTDVFNPTVVSSDPDGELIVLSQNGTVWTLKRSDKK
ncbi:MAG: PQQ-dependent sugar dehydrogenase [Verrucomicrobiales bacterium]|nr:PQQ-dependent sugar dehydrogenase [Verrucomicrobiales bacterium]